MPPPDLRTVSPRVFRRALPRGLMAASLCAALAACAAPTSTPSRPVSVEVPATWSAPAPPLGASSLSDWWCRFDDALLTRLVSQSPAANPTVAGANQQALQASEATLQAGAAARAIGETVRCEIFGGSAGETGLGQQLRVQQFSCDVIGILSPKGQGGVGDQDDIVVVVPLHTLQHRVTGSRKVGALRVAMQRTGWPA